jgi:hypothetical protein
MKTLYSQLLKRALKLNIVNKTSQVLVVGGGSNDSTTL